MSDHYLSQNKIWADHTLKSPTHKILKFLVSCFLLRKNGYCKTYQNPRGLETIHDFYRQVDMI